MGKRYRSFISHVHSAFEGPATMEGFCSEAAATGIDLVWFSDHDTRIVRCAEPFDAPAVVPVLIDPPQPALPLWWQVVEGVEITPPFPWLMPPVGDMPPRVPPRAHAKPAKPDVQTLSTGATRVRLHGADAEWGAATLSLRATSARWARPLCTRPIIELGLDTEMRRDDPDRRLVLEVELGQRPPGLELAVLRYVWGNSAMLEGAGELPLRNGKVRLDVAREAERIGVCADHIPHRLRIRLESRRGATAEVCLRGPALSSERSSPEALLRWQAGRAAELGRHYDVQTLVGYELSGTGTHLVAYGHLPPLIEHRDERPVLPHREAARFLREKGCVLSLNHPFSSVRNALAEGEPPGQIVLRRAEQIRDHDVYGAQMIEVGFPAGRQGFSVAHYLALWDQLSLWGVRLSGVGVSDAHANYRWDTGNNFANYVPTSTGAASEWVAALEQGDFFMADPARFRGTFDMATDNGIPMGGTQSGGTIRLKTTGLPSSCTLRWVIDGKSAGQATIDGHAEAALPLDGMEHFARAEISMRDGRLILLSNPVWAET